MDQNNESNIFPPLDAEGRISRCVKRLAHLNIPDGAQVVEQDGYLFIGHLSPPEGTSIIDVRNPLKPRLVASIVLPDLESHSHKVMVAGDLMIVNSQRHRRKFFRKSEKLEEVESKLSVKKGAELRDKEIAVALGIKPQEVGVLRAELTYEYRQGGFRIYDIADPAKPRELCFRPTGGMGVHGFDFDGQYAYVSTEMAGFRGNILVIYDLSDPLHPLEVSRWCLPGQEAGDSKLTGPLKGNWLHHALRSGNVLWAACSQAGIWAIDIADITCPVTVGTYNYHPPFPESTHTVMAIPQTHHRRKLALAIDEEHDNHPRGQPHAALWICDVHQMDDIKPLSVFEVSELDSPWSRSGSRFGASQIVEHPTGDLVFAAWFAGGLRIVDISEPASPSEYGYFIPPPGPGLSAQQSMDVEVDTRGIIYLLDRNSGIDILELS